MPLAPPDYARIVATLQKWPYGKNLAEIARLTDRQVFDMQDGGDEKDTELEAAPPATPQTPEEAAEATLAFGRMLIRVGGAGFTEDELVAAVEKAKTDGTSGNGGAG